MFKSRFWRKEDGTESFMYNLLTLLSFGGVPIAEYIHSRKNGEVGTIKEQIKDDFSSGSSGLSKLLSNKYVDNWLDSQTGAGLTDAQKDANFFNAEQAQLQRDFELQLSNTAKQRQVADLKAAGLNPMLAAGEAVSLPSAVAAQSVSPGSATLGLDSVLKFIEMFNLLPLQKRAVEQDINESQSRQRKNESETKGFDILNNYRAESEELRLQGLGLTNQLTAQTRSKVIKECDLIAENIRKTANEADTEVERKAALVASRMLSEVMAWQIVQMMPYQKALASAQSEAARSAALLSAADAAYKNGLIDSGYIEAQLRSLDASATNTEIRNAAEAVKTAFRTGKMPEGYEDTFGPVDSWTVRNILMPLKNVLENINPLAGLIKIAQ